MLMIRMLKNKRVEGLVLDTSEQNIVEKCKYVVLAVKPQMFEEVLDSIALLLVIR